MTAKSQAELDLFTGASSFWLPLLNPSSITVNANTASAAEKDAAAAQLAWMDGAPLDLAGYTSFQGPHFDAGDMCARVVPGDSFIYDVECFLDGVSALCEFDCEKGELKMIDVKDPINSF